MVALGVSIPVDPALAESLDKPFPWTGHQRRSKSYGGGWTTQPTPKRSPGGWSGP